MREHRRRASRRRFEDITDSGTTPEVDAGPPSTASLDGRWTITKAPATFFGSVFSGGTIAAGSDTYTMTLDAGDVGEIDPNDANCTIGMDNTVVTVTITGTTDTGSVTSNFQDTGSSCDNTGAVANPIATIALEQTTASTPTVTPYDGVWAVTLTAPNGGGDDDDDGGSSSVAATVTIAGSTWTSMAASGEDFFKFTRNGSFANGLATGTDGIQDFAAQKQ